MKRLSTIMMCLFAMMAASLSAKAQEVTITLYPGWTWISYPKAEVLDINTALGDFVPMEGDIIKSQFSNSTYIRGSWRGGVTHFIPGWGYMYYSNKTEVVSFVFASPTPQSQVQVTTSEPMLITAISAMGGGEVNTTDGTYIIVKGLCWATHENPTTNDDFYEEAESGVGTFSISMTELNIATTYYVRAYAVTPNGTVYGDQKTFTTQDGIPILTTAEVTNIGNISAICGGTIISDGGLTTTRGVCWSTSQHPTVTDSHSNDGYGIGSFESQITGLTENTTYYVRAYASNSNITVYGDEVSFTTFVVPAGAIEGLFSVSDSQQVYFSQGNLQYQPSTSTWRFAENQYDLCELGQTIYHWFDGNDYHTTLSFEEYQANGNELDYISYDVSTQYTSSYTGWIDLFSWGTSGYNHGAVCYQPWSTSKNTGDYYAYGDGQYNLYDQNGQADWGYNAISNGGNAENNGWRTLTQSEWDYVLNTRSTPSGIRYAMATVSGVSGTILLPDNWNTSICNLNNPNDPHGYYGSNVLTASQWSVLEQAGAAFLPGAGHRNGAEVILIEPLVYTHEYYWSSSMGFYYSVAYCLCPNEPDGNPNYQRISCRNKSIGQSVRLVRRAE